MNGASTPSPQTTVLLVFLPVKPEAPPMASYSKA